MTHENRVDVSVVIPFFNADKVVERALSSIAKQSRLPVEVVVVDDASTSQSALKLDEILQKFPVLNVRMITLAINAGAASARNAGWDTAKGQYIAFLDSDDAWHPLKLELQVRYFEENSGVGVCAHGHEVSGPDVPWPVIGKPLATGVRVSAKMLLIKNRFITPAVMLRRDIAVRFEERQRHMEDHLLWTRLAMSGVTIEYLPVPLARIFKRSFGDGGLSSQLIAMQLADTKNYWKLRALGYLGFPQAILYTAFSIAKFFRRISIVAARRVLQSIKAPE